MSGRKISPLGRANGSGIYETTPILGKRTFAEALEHFVENRHDSIKRVKLSHDDSSTCKHLRNVVSKLYSQESQSQQSLREKDKLLQEAVTARTNAENRANQTVADAQQHIQNLDDGHKALVLQKDNKLLEAEHARKVAEAALNEMSVAVKDSREAANSDVQVVKDFADSAYDKLKQDSNKEKQALISYQTKELQARDQTITDLSQKLQNSENERSALSDRAAAYWDESNAELNRLRSRILELEAANAVLNEQSLPNAGMEIDSQTTQTFPANIESSPVASIEVATPLRPAPAASLPSPPGSDDPSLPKMPTTKAKNHLDRAKSKHPDASKRGEARSSSTTSFWERLQRDEKAKMAARAYLKDIQEEEQEEDDGEDEDDDDDEEEKTTVDLAKKKRDAASQLAVHASHNLRNGETRAKPSRKPKMDRGRVGKRGKPDRKSLTRSKKNDAVINSTTTMIEVPDSTIFETMSVLHDTASSEQKETEAEWMEDAECAWMKGDYAEVKLHRLYWDLRAEDRHYDCVVYFSHRSDGTPVRVSLTNDQLDPTEKDEHLVPMGEEPKDLNSALLFARMSLMSQLPDLQAQAAATFLKGKKLDNFEMRLFGGKKKPAKMCIEEEQDPSTWRTVISQLLKSPKFKESCRHFANGKEARYESPWPPSYRDKNMFWSCTVYNSVEELKDADAKYKKPVDAQEQAKLEEGAKNTTLESDKDELDVTRGSTTMDGVVGTLDRVERSYRLTIPETELSEVMQDTPSENRKAAWTHDPNFRESKPESSDDDSEDDDDDE